jgi:hypothetical protein
MSVPLMLNGAVVLGSPQKYLLPTQDSAAAADPDSARCCGARSFLTRLFCHRDIIISQEKL